MRRSMLRSLAGIVLILIVSVTCSKESQRALTDTATTTMVEVSLRFTGITHLIGTSPDERLLMVPNLTTASTKHFPVILASKTFGSNLPKEDRRGNRVYKWGDLTPGFTIDLSGLDTTLPLNRNLKLREVGDPRTLCPDSTTPPTAPESLHWLPRLSFVSRVTGTPAVDPKFTMADPSKDDVAIRLPIVRGRLEADTVSKKIAGFVDGASTIATQGVAAYLRLRYQVVLKRNETTKKFEYELTGTRFTNAGTGTFSLGKFEPSGDEIEIIFANLPKDAFFNPPTTIPTNHFHLAYQNIVSGVAPTAVSIMNNQRCGGGSVGSEVECGPVRVP